MFQPISKAWMTHLTVGHHWSWMRKLHLLSLLPLPRGSWVKLCWKGTSSLGSKNGWMVFGEKKSASMLCRVITPHCSWKRETLLHGVVIFGISHKGFWNLPWMPGYTPFLLLITLRGGVRGWMIDARSVEIFRPFYMFFLTVVYLLIRDVTI